MNFGKIPYAFSYTKVQIVIEKSYLIVLCIVREKDAISSDVRAKKKASGAILGPWLFGLSSAAGHVPLRNDDVS